MNDIPSRIGRRAGGQRRVTGIPAARTVAAAALGVVLATGTVQAPDSPPQPSSGQARTGPGGS
jgi:hypothetical protein